MFRHFTRISAGASFLLQGVFLSSVLKISEPNDYAREVHTSESIRCKGPWFPNFLRGVVYLLRNARCAWIPRLVCSFAKTTWISASLYWNTQPICIEFFIKATDPFSTTFLRLSAGLTVNLSVPEYALFAKNWISNQTCNFEIREDANNHTTDEVISARFLIFLPEGPLPVGALPFEGFLPSCCVCDLGAREDDRAFFPRLLSSWRKLQASPFEHCPFDFHWKHSPSFLSTLTFFPVWVLIQLFRFWLWSFVFWSFDLYVSSPWSSTSDNSTVIDLDGFLVTVWNWSDSRIRILYNLSRILSLCNFLVDNRAWSHLEKTLGYRHLVKNSLMCSTHSEVLFEMIFSKADAIFAWSISKFGNLCPPIDCDVSRSSISTSLIHNRASVGKLEQEHTSVLKLVFQQMDAQRSANWSKFISETWFLGCSTMQFFIWPPSAWEGGFQVKTSLQISAWGAKCWGFLSNSFARSAGLPVDTGSHCADAVLLEFPKNCWMFTRCRKVFKKRFLAKWVSCLRLQARITVYHSTRTRNTHRMTGRED